MLHDKDPKQYWKLIEELKDTQKIDTTSSISTSSWQSHFQNLNNPKDIFKNRIKRCFLIFVDLYQNISYSCSFSYSW
jgi:hypothetical protein